MKLYYRELGKGNKHTIIILHGLYGCSDNWLSIAKQLSENFHIIIPDLRNHGQSPHSDIHNYQAMMDDVIELLDDLKINKCNIIGHSMGGRLATHITLNHSDRIENIIIADITPMQSNENDDRNNEHYNFHTGLINDLQKVDLDNVSTFQEADEELSNYITDRKLKAFILKNIKKTPDGLKWKFNLESLSKNLEFIMLGIPIKNLEHIKIKNASLFLRGALSDYIKIEDYKPIKAIFVNCQIIEIPDAGHWLHAEQPSLFIKNVLYFLDRYDDIKPII